ncbi:hypothetical protein SMICM304S_00682 [Streptomyces microflavus]
MERRRAGPTAQSRVRGSMSWVVEALVSSVPWKFPGQPVRDQIGDQQQPAWLPRVAESLERRRVGRGCCRGRAGCPWHGRARRAGRWPTPSRRRRPSWGRGSGRDCRGEPPPRPGARSPRPSCRCRGSSTAGRAEPVEDPVVQPQDVPAQPLRQPHRTVGEAVGPGEVQGAGADAADHYAPVGGAQVDGGERLRALAHRRKAPATPASTGMWRPVVWVRSPPVRATAPATCSGRTSRLRRVRRA